MIAAIHEEPAAVAASLGRRAATEICEKAASLKETSGFWPRSATSDYAGARPYDRMGLEIAE